MALPEDVHPVDLHVGSMIRMRRKLLGISQEQLADALKLTFQQVQKYERGANRVSASKLFLVAQALNTTPAFFFPPAEALDDGPDGSSELLNFFGQTGGLEIARLFVLLTSPQRTNVIRVAQAIVDATAPQEQAIAA
jgi:transcriptional regulator with XRE-family HTH domain